MKGSFETVDVVDESDKPIGKKPRNAVHASKLWHRGIHVLIKNSKGELLLPVRSKARDKFPNKYDTSISEHVSSGETFDEAAKKGLKEELGIANPKLKEIAKIRFRYGKNDNMISKIYLLEYDGEINFDRGEISKIEFLPPEKVRAMLNKNEKKFAIWAREILKWHFKMPSLLEEIRSD
ncbi:MAG: NUDIX domain-containing protein [Candidatus Diapherotrites archaeon]|nr:NUDIX domain-containing protein [Candidatus Diapherotrites archaeon]